MTQQELNNFILRYLVANKTKSAIMLTGGWGTGKSHYILNSLIPFLGEEKNGKHQCIVVSLYGMKDSLDISKAIYLECRAKFLQAKSETVAAGMLVGKSIIKGVTSFFGVDLSKNDSDMQLLFESIDLAGKLIVLEDLERSGISILEVLGYVNNLVEQDGVKVLLVANEQEILSTERKIVKPSVGPEITKEILTEQTRQYLRIKEKTVSDTIQYSEDFSVAIQEIIHSFNNTILNRFASSNSVKNIIAAMASCKSWNLRSFIYACQKTVDIYNMLGSSTPFNDDFLETIFYGILFYVFRMKSGKNMTWKQGDMFSIELGGTQYPLFKFCYDYLTNQVINIARVQESQDALKEYRLFDKNKSNTDPDIYTLSTFHLHTEEEVEAALQNIEDRLENHPEEISFYMYGTIAVYAITYKDCVGRNIDKIKQCLIRNLKGKGTKLNIDSIRRTILSESSSIEAKEEYQNLVVQMKDALEGGQPVFTDFDYSPEQAQQFRCFIDENYKSFHLRDGYMCDLNMTKLAEMFYQSTPAQKDEIRTAFRSMYADSGIKAVMSRDCDSIRQLLQLVKKQRFGDVGDRINQLQYDWFIDDLEKAAKKLS